MATLQAQDIADVVSSTLRELNKGKLSQVAQSLQRYEVVSRWFRRDQRMITGGYGIQQAVMTKLDENAADHVGLFEEDTINVADLLVLMQVDFVHAQTKWAYDVREMMMNRSSAKIVDLVKARETGAFIKLADKLEAAAWADRATTNTKDPNGIPHYCVYNATTGFNGSVPTGHTTVAAIDPTVHTNWKNYTAQYTDVTKGDLIKLMRTAHRKIQFFSPLTTSGDTAARLADRYRIYLNETTISSIEDLGTAQNDNLGADIASMDGRMVFKGHPMIWIPYLDDNAASGSDPVYMIDTKSIFPAILAGNFFRQTGPKEAAKQHNVMEVFKDITYQYVCINRRALALIATADPF